jgi:hypothetical protein
MAYALKADVKAYLDVSGTGSDDLIDDLLDRATAVIDQYTGRTFAAAADTEQTLDAAGKHITARAIYLDRDLCSITTITNGDGIEVASTEYVTVPANETPYYAIRIKGSAGKTWTYSTDWESAITIEGRWAYSTTPPDDIVHACVRLASFYYRQRDAQMMDVTAIEAGVVLKPMGMPADVRMALAPYRRLA